MAKKFTLCVSRIGKYKYFALLNYLALKHPNACSLGLGPAHHLCVSCCTNERSFCLNAQSISWLQTTHFSIDLKELHQEVYPHFTVETV